MRKLYTLVNEALNMKFGTISFNGKFVFELYDNIDNDTWNKIGIIPLKQGVRKIEIDGDQFYYLNSRLPQNLRSESSEKKLDYIDKTGLRVASDSFILEKIKT